jgi:phage terminase large subunit
MGASNPGGIGHGWVKKLFISRNTQDNEQQRFFYVHANAYDNKYISQEYIKQLESLPEQQRKAYLEGSWDVFAGQYFDMWSVQKHVIVPFVPAKNELIVGGMDWGRAKPFSFHLARVTKEYFRTDDGDIVWFYRTKTFLEVYGVNKNPEEWSELIQQEMLNKFSLTLQDVSWVQADPTIFNKNNDNSMSIRDQFYAHDDRWRIIQPAKNERKPGWVYMVHWLSQAPDGKPYWQVTDNCVNLIRTLPELVHNEPPGDVEDIDTEGEDHAADDQRYMLRNLKLIEGKTGQIMPKTNEDNAKKFYGSNEDAGKFLVDLDKFS